MGEAITSYNVVRFVFLRVKTGGALLFDNTLCRPALFIGFIRVQVIKIVLVVSHFTWVWITYNFFRNGLISPLNSIAAIWLETRNKLDLVSKYWTVNNLCDYACSKSSPTTKHTGRKTYSASFSCKNIRNNTLPYIMNNAMVFSRSWYLGCVNEYIWDCLMRCYLGGVFLNFFFFL